MAYFQPIPEGKADADVKRVFEEIRKEKRLPFVPNFFKTLAHAPDALEVTWAAYRGLTTRGALPEALKEMIFVAISVARDCEYCHAAHLAFCSLLGVESADLVLLSQNVDALRPERTRDVIRFSVKCALSPRALEPADYDRLRRHGLTNSEIIEAVAMCGFSMYAITVADALRLDVDPEIADILAVHQAAA